MQLSRKRPSEIEYSARMTSDIPDWYDEATSVKDSYSLESRPQ